MSEAPTSEYTAAAPPPAVLAQVCLYSSKPNTYDIIDFFLYHENLYFCNVQFKIELADLPHQIFLNSCIFVIIIST